MSRLCVSEVMHSCASATIRPECTLRDAAERILITGLESLPVVDDSGCFIGLVVQAALIRELLSSHTDDASVAPIIARHVDSARCTASLDGVLPLFRSAGITMVPVVDADGCPVGLVHRRDVIQYLLDDSRKSSDALSAADEPGSGPHFLRDRRKKKTDR